MKHIKKILACALAVALTAPMGAMATNGYFSHGYGVKSKSMGGTGVANPKDSIAAASNPAGMVHVGNRVDAGLELFNPNRENTQNGGNAGTTESNSTLFGIPHFGYNTMLDSSTSFGVSVYANGGMNTDYPTNNGVFGAAATSLGVDLAQLMVAPTWSKKLTNGHSVGASVILAYQRFKATGLQNFGVIDPDYDDSTGWGVRIGWMGKINDRLTLGASYQSKIYMSEFDKYKGLFAEQGDFDIPANATIGLSYQVDKKTTVDFDIQHIGYGEVRSISNNINASVNLGTDDGRGFGWNDQTVYKLGVEHQYNNQWTVRGGLNYGEAPYDNTQMDFNILAPATVEWHLTLGATYKLSDKNEVDFGYMHAFSNEIVGQSAGFGLNEIKHEMDQNALFVNYAWKF